MYSEAVTRQTTDDFIRCIENALYHFGGAPRHLVLDNLRTAVKKADWFEPELNPIVRSFAAHYGTVFLPARPYRPTYKGKVESGVGYVQDSALKGRTFDSLEGQNQFLLDWEHTVADTRVHGTIRHQVGKLFLEVERPVLLPLPVDRFPSFHESRRVVHRDGHIEVDKAYYSVAPEYLARSVWVRWDARIVRVFNHKMEQIAGYPKQQTGAVQHRPEAYRLGEDQRGGAGHRLAAQSRPADRTAERSMGRGDDRRPWGRRRAGDPGPPESDAAATTRRRSSGPARRHTAMERSGSGRYVHSSTARPRARSSSLLSISIRSFVNFRITSNSFMTRFRRRDEP